MKKIALIGATGSIGRQVIETVQRHSDKYKIVALCANRAGGELERAKTACGAEFAAAAAEDPAAALSVASYPSADLVFNAAGGFAGLRYSLEAINAGKTLALSNKETLVCGGDFIMPLAEKKGATIVPVDSEHSALWQCLNFNARGRFSRLIITASGGPFYGYTQAQLEKVTPAQALNHPTWKMGAKITVDSATMLNKGYEIIEAHHLFGADYGAITAVVQPQSIVHSLVEFADGALLAQMSYPTMEVPVQLALSYPERLETRLTKTDFTKPFNINFLPLDKEAFPVFALAVGAGKEGGILPCALNAASEVAVKAFLEGRIKFTDIYRVLDGVLNTTRNAPADGYEAVAEADAEARAAAISFL